MLRAHTLEERRRSTSYYELIAEGCVAARKRAELARCMQCCVKVDPRIRRPPRVVHATGRRESGASKRKEKSSDFKAGVPTNEAISQ